MKQELRKAISSYRPDAEIRNSQDVSGHSNDTFLVELEDEEVVCTLCTFEDGARSCRKEVKIPQIVVDRTKFPVPEILYSDCNAEVPFYITRKVEGENAQDVLENRVSEEKQLIHEQKKELFKNIGRMMGELHSTFQFSGAGEIILENSDLTIENGKPPDQYLRKELEQEAEKLGKTRFSDMEEEVRELIPKLMENLESYPNVLVHRDIRPDNMIIDGTEVKALFDFEEALSCHPAFDYAYAEKHLVYPHRYFEVEDPGSKKVEGLEKALETGYTEKIDVDDDWRQQVETFKLVELIQGMNSFQWYADKVGWSEEKRDQDEKQTRKIFREKREKLGL